jgi:hypothetical protein
MAENIIEHPAVAAKRQTGCDQKVALAAIPSREGSDKAAGDGHLRTRPSGFAYHEAGHAVAGLVLRLPLIDVSIERTVKGQGGCTSFVPSRLKDKYDHPRYLPWARRMAVMCCAGERAQTCARPRQQGLNAGLWAAADDTEQMEAMFAELPYDVAIAETERAYAEADALVARKWREIENVARSLQHWKWIPDHWVRAAMETARLRHLAEIPVFTRPFYDAMEAKQKRAA